MTRFQHSKFLAGILATLIALSPSLSLGCTTFSIPQSNEKIVGKSYDWFQNHGYALVNLRNLKKKALLLTNDRAAEWTSRYGSLTFNQHGREMPLGGQNEKGLTVEIMWLDDSAYPASGAQPAVNELQWIQFQLDNAATVNEAVQLAQTVRVIPALAKVHYLVCDRSGQCATFEYLGGKLAIHEGTKAPISVLTNDTYADSLKFLVKHVGFGGTLQIPGDAESLSRFARAAQAVAKFDAAEVKDPVAYAFQTLASVEQPNYTTWNIVYEASNQRAHFRTQGMPKIKTIDTSKLDYSCKQKPQFVDMKASTSGDVTHDLAAFEPANNQALVKLGLGAFALQLPQGTVGLVTKYPATLKCME
jgi:penicillin V acylase-like amidase (Ntn superfamily)